MEGPQGPQSATIEASQMEYASNVQELQVFGSSTEGNYFPGIQELQVFGSSTEGNYFPGILEQVQILQGFSVLDGEPVLEAQVLDASVRKGRTNSKRIQQLDEVEIIAVRKYEAMMKREYRKRRLTQKQDEGASNREEPTIEEDFQSRKRRSSETIVHHIISELSVYGREDQKEVIQAVLNDKRILQWSQDKVHDHSLDILSAFRISLQALKNPKSNDELFLKRSALTMLVNGLMQLSDSRNKGISLIKVSNLLGIHPRNLYAALRRVDNDVGASSMLPLDLCKRQLTHSKLDDEVKDIVVKFWTEQTRVSPNKKDIVRRRTGRKQYIEHPVHLLDESQVMSHNLNFSHYCVLLSVM